jgi:hypothetical protein
MMPALPAKQLDRLVKVAGLLASDQPGEVFNAALAATRILHEPWLTGTDLAAASITTVAPTCKASRSPRSAPASDWRCDIAACRARPDLISDWEQRFLQNLTSFASMSMKQSTVLARLRERVRTAGAAP